MTLETIAAGVITALVVALVLGVLAFVRRRARRAWLRRYPVGMAVQHLSHVPPDVDVALDSPEINAAYVRIVREPWAMALKGDLPAAATFEASQPSNPEVHEWLRANGAIDYRETKLRLSLTSRTEEPIVVRDIRVDVERSRPWNGTYVYCPTAGTNVASLLIFELDEDEPRARRWKEGGVRRRVGRRPFFDHHSVSIEPGETHDFVIIGRAVRLLARWRLLVTLEIAGHKKTVVVDDGGERFRTCGEPVGGFRTRLHWAWYAGGHFVPEPDRPA